MSGIICAIRGGPASRSTIRRAIQLAKEGQQLLTILYVVNLDFLQYTAHSRLRTILEEMQQLGEMIARMAQETATSEGVHCDIVVRQGKVDEEIVSLCQELGADIIVLGKPLRSLGATVFTNEQLDALNDRLSAHCRARVVVEP